MKPAGVKLTGWLFTDARALIDCPKPTCRAKAGACCLTPKGRKAWPPHIERTDALVALVGNKPFTR